MTNDNRHDTNENITELGHSPTLPENREDQTAKVKRVGLVCPNCDADLQGRKCKLLCVRPGCGYQVTCSEW